MNRYLSLYFLLGFLIILGAFASMAQNSYGMSLLGVVAAIFALLFLSQWVGRTRKKGLVVDARTVELISLAVMSILISLKIFQVSFTASRWLMLAAGAALVAVYGRSWLTFVREGKDLPPTYRAFKILYYWALILFVISFAVSDIAYRFSNTLVVLALAAGLVCFVLVLMNRKFLVNGTEETDLSWVLARKDRSALLMVMLTFMSLYLLLSKAGVLPQLYSDEYPPAFYTLQDKRDDGAKAGKSIDHREFKREYLHFVERNLK
jgi:hypothetical protein